MTAGWSILRFPGTCPQGVTGAAVIPSHEWPGHPRWRTYVADRPLGYCSGLSQFGDEVLRGVSQRRALREVQVEAGSCEPSSEVQGRLSSCVGQSGRLPVQIQGEGIRVPLWWEEPCKC